MNFDFFLISSIGFFFSQYIYMIFFIFLIFLIYLPNWITYIIHFLIFNFYPWIEV